jgi:hypothetical protein
MSPTRRSANHLNYKLVRLDAWPRRWRRLCAALVAGPIFISLYKRLSAVAGYASFSLKDYNNSAIEPNSGL